MAAKNGIKLSGPRQRGTQNDRNNQAGIFPVVHVRKYDHL